MQKTNTIASLDSIDKFIEQLFLDPIEFEQTGSYFDHLSNKDLFDAYFIVKSKKPIFCYIQIDQNFKIKKLDLFEKSIFS